MHRALSLALVLRALSLLGGEVMGVEGDLRAAQDADPVSFDIRQAQVEVLLRVKRLDEAVLVARAARDLFPGNAQAQSAYATALAMKVTHEDVDEVTRLGAALEADRAWKMDPASSVAIERIMFLLAASGSGGNLSMFRDLGMRRGALSGGAALDMRCKLCGKHWLAHRPKRSGEASNPK